MGNRPNPKFLDESHPDWAFLRSEGNVRNGKTFENERIQSADFFYNHNHDEPQQVPAKSHLNDFGEPEISYTMNPFQQADTRTAGTTTASSNVLLALGEQNDDTKPRRAVDKEAEDKRKAKNRVAQKAFRERRERHVHDLNQTVETLEHGSSKLRRENENLQQEIARMISENLVLKEAKKLKPTFVSQQTSDLPKFTSAEFFDLAVPDGHEKRPEYRLTVDNRTGERLLDVGATWELIQQHESFNMDALDLPKLCGMLREIVQCDGQGPVFGEKCIFFAIEASVISEQT